MRTNKKYIVDKYNKEILINIINRRADVEALDINAKNIVNIFSKVCSNATTKYINGEPDIYKEAAFLAYVISKQKKVTKEKNIDLAFKIICDFVDSYETNEDKILKQTAVNKRRKRIDAELKDINEDKINALNEYGYYEFKKIITFFHFKDNFLYSDLFGLGFFVKDLFNCDIKHEQTYMWDGEEHLPTIIEYTYNHEKGFILKSNIPKLNIKRLEKKI